MHNLRVTSLPCALSSPGKCGNTFAEAAAEYKAHRRKTEREWKGENGKQGINFLPLPSPFPFPMRSLTDRALQSRIGIVINIMSRDVPRFTSAITSSLGGLWQGSHPQPQPPWQDKDNAVEPLSCLGSVFLKPQEDLCT